jgi:hypothetical protein
MLAMQRHIGGLPTAQHHQPQVLHWIPLTAPHDMTRMIEFLVGALLLVFVAAALLQNVLRDFPDFFCRQFFGDCTPP